MTTKHRTVPLSETITKVPGMPDKLVIFKIPASKYWWVRYFTSGRIVKKSTKSENKKEAFKIAERFYEDIIIRERNLLPITQSPTFERCSEELFEEQENLIKRGERNKLLNRNDKQIYKSDLYPYFKNHDIRTITYKHINNYLSYLSERDLKPATLKKHTNLLHKIFVYAQKTNIITNIPAFPQIRQKDNPRGWFSDEEYLKLRTVTKELIKKKELVRGYEITDEIRYIITFSVNTFLRPSDIKNLKHRNIQVIDEEEKRYLRILRETSKVSTKPMVSMEVAVSIYKSLVGYHKKINNPIGKDDYLFFPKLTNRDYAYATMTRIFNKILEDADLKVSPSGEERTLYSLRHTAIMFRLTKGHKMDLLTLARSCDTSVGMIERFYAGPLTAEMNIDMLQSLRTKKSTKS